jgi:hypothetical protein
MDKLTQELRRRPVLIPSIVTCGLYGVTIQDDHEGRRQEQRQGCSGSVRSAANLDRRPEGNSAHTSAWAQH